MTKRLLARSAAAAAVLITVGMAAAPAQAAEVQALSPGKNVAIQVTEAGTLKAPTLVSPTGIFSDSVSWWCLRLNFLCG